MGREPQVTMMGCGALGAAMDHGFSEAAVGCAIPDVTSASAAGRVAAVVGNPRGEKHFQPPFGTPARLTHE